MDILTSGYFFWIVGFLAGEIYFFVDAPFFETKRPVALLYGLIDLVVLCLGAKLLYIVENPAAVLEYGLTFRGFSLFGAIFIQPLAVWIIARLFRKNYGEVASFLIIPFLIMLGFYRVDCFISGCCGGIAISGFVVPTQWIEACFVWMLAAIFIYLTHARDWRDGRLFDAFFAIYGLFRFVLEFFRVRDNLFSLFALSHIWAFLSLVLGILLILRRKRRAQ